MHKPERSLDHFCCASNLRLEKSQRQQQEQQQRVRRDAEKGSRELRTLSIIGTGACNAI